MITSLPSFLRRNRDRYGDRLALHSKQIFRLEKVTHAQLYDLCAKMGTWLADNGLKAGDRIFIWAPNSPAWAVAYLGCLAHGIVVVPADAHSSRELVTKYANQTKAKLLLTSAFFTHRPAKLKAINLEELLEQLQPLSRRDFPRLKATGLAELIFTSGTTGKPKGVQITRKNIVAAINALVPKLPAASEYRVLSILPLSHVMEQVVGLLGTLYYGASIYYLANPNALTMKRALSKYRITHLGLVPQVLRLLWQAVEIEAEKQGRLGRLKLALKLAAVLPRPGRRFIFSSLHRNLGGSLDVLGCGSAPLDLEAASNWERVGVKVLEGYGASETTSVISLNTLGEQRLGSVGRVLDEIKLRLADDGEILVKGEVVTPGYYQQEELNQASFTPDGYFKTGDVGRLDQDGFLYITGRTKFRIVTAAGDKVYPEEIEQQINRIPEVIDSCVVGLPQPGGEEIALALRLKSGAELSQVVEKIKRRLESKQHPSRVSLWPEDDFPRTHTLKVSRDKVKDWFVAGESKPSDKDTIREDKLINLLSRVAGRSLLKASKNQSLQELMQLDSLKRATLAAFLEQEFGLEIPELELSHSKMTVGKLRKLIKSGRVSRSSVGFPAWPRSEAVQQLREGLRQAVLFPIVDHWVTGIRVEGKQNLAKINNPSILISNHVGNFDLTLIMRVLPPKIRRRLFAVADAEHYKQNWRAGLLYLLGNAYSMVKDGSQAKQELEFITDLIDQNWTLLITPEGEYGQTEGEMEAFRRGTALIAVETQTPVVPFKIENFDRIYKSVKTFPYQPDGKGEITLKIGPPKIYPRSASYQEVSEDMRAQIESL